MKDAYGLHPDYAVRIVDKVDCPKCGAERCWPCIPLRQTGFATCLRPHRERAWVAAGGSLPMPSAARGSKLPKASDAQATHAAVSG